MQSFYLIAAEILGTAITIQAIPYSDDLSFPENFFADDDSSDPVSSTVNGGDLNLFQASKLGDNVDNDNLLSASFLGGDLLENDLVDDHLLAANPSGPDVADCQPASRKQKRDNSDEMMWGKDGLELHISNDG